MLVAVVGVCASGKTTLVKRLQELGVDAYNVAQEHSGIKRLWQKKQPDVLVMLDATLPAIQKRRAVSWGEDRLVAQRERLLDAKQHADLFIQTDSLSQEAVAQTVVDYIRRDIQVGQNYSRGFEKRS
jgi:adenylate kinase